MASSVINNHCSHVQLQHILLGHFGEQKYFLSLTGIKPDSLPVQPVAWSLYWLCFLFSSEHFTTVTLVNCNWVDTRWQLYSTHFYTKSTQNNTMKLNTQNRIYIQDTCTQLIRSIQNIQPYIQWYKRIWKNVMNETSKKAAIHMWSTYLIMMTDTQLLRTLADTSLLPLLNFTSLHFTPPQIWLNHI
jgi:hypothetical protein